jgi:hypothetical protein
MIYIAPRLKLPIQDMEGRIQHQEAEAFFREIGFCGQHVGRAV